MPKAAGFDVEVLDYLNAEGLREKYSEAGLDVPGQFGSSTKSSLPPLEMICGLSDVDITASSY
jgi:hypothetical protein